MTQIYTLKFLYDLKRTPNQKKKDFLKEKKSFGGEKKFFGGKKNFI